MPAKRSDFFNRHTVLAGIIGTVGAAVVLGVLQFGRDKVAESIEERAARNLQVGANKAEIARLWREVARLKRENRLR